MQTQISTRSSRLATQRDNTRPYYFSFSLGGSKKHCLVPAAREKPNGRTAGTQHPHPEAFCFEESRFWVTAELLAAANQVYFFPPIPRLSTQISTRACSPLGEVTPTPAPASLGRFVDCSLAAAFVRSFIVSHSVRR